LKLYEKSPIQLSILDAAFNTATLMVMGTLEIIDPHTDLKEYMVCIIYLRLNIFILCLLSPFSVLKYFGSRVLHLKLSQ
jgi:hypothetical protein